MPRRGLCCALEQKFVLRFHVHLECQVFTKSKERIWLASVKLLDFSGSIEVSMREKAALQLSGLCYGEDEKGPIAAQARHDFEEAHAAGQLQWPLLASVRVVMKRRADAAQLGSQAPLCIVSE